MKADHEGYFLFNIATDFNLHDLTDKEGYLLLTVSFIEDNAAFAKAKRQKRIKINKFTGETLVPYSEAAYGVISDIDDTIIEEIILEQSDLSMTFRGGHNYEILEDDTVVYEFKTGPYLGIEFDKTFI